MAIVATVSILLAKTAAKFWVWPVKWRWGPRHTTIIEARVRERTIAEFSKETQGLFKRLGLEHREIEQDL